MKLCTYRIHGKRVSGLLIDDEVVSLSTVNHLLDLSSAITLSGLLKSGLLPEFCAAVRSQAAKLKGRGTPSSLVPFTAPYPDPPKIWCIGLNYLEHAGDLGETRPEEPASFMRPAVTMIGPGDTIYLPPQSQRVTGEGELAVVIGQRSKNVSPDEAFSVIAGFLPAIDMTAEDILRRNPRFLTRAKSFDTFLSLGPYLVTVDEVGDASTLDSIRVSTLLNGEVKRTSSVGNMRHKVSDLIAFHSQVMTWEPGDILLTGTPGAVVLSPGDSVGCEVEGIGLLENPVAQRHPA
jgi:2-keto-4-pentenoate hydratase/2-oxohepta-3-ene-1,7-dioic acid hydratase in catechol pathway